MSKLPAQVAEFLSAGAIAVAGVSRDPQQPANYIYRKLKGSGHEVFAVNPNASQLEGGPSYPDLRSIAQPVAQAEQSRPWKKETRPPLCGGLSNLPDYSDPGGRLLEAHRSPLNHYHPETGSLTLKAT